MEDFAEKRLEICRNCAIMRNTQWGMKCDDRKWLDVINNVASFFRKPGWKRGCGCLLVRKAANINNHCPCGKW